MRKVDVLIVGAGPAGLSTARSYRAAGGKGSVMIAGDERHLPYRRPPLTKHFLRDPFPVDELFIEPPSFFDEKEIELSIGTRIQGLDPSSRRVRTSEGEEIEYQDLVLATGSEPIRPPIPGAGDPETLVMRRIEDSQALAQRSSTGGTAIVVGSGFIGCEAAASLAMRGNDVTLVSMETLPQEERLGPHAGHRIASWLSELGTNLRLGVAIEAIETRRDAGSVRLDSGEVIEAGLVVLGTGVRPRVGLARDAGLPVGSERVIVDQSMRSPVKGVWAVGDLALALNAAAGRRLRVEHWGEALIHGEVAGEGLAGRDARWDSVPGFWSTIGEKTIKYRAWGDGFDDHRFEKRGQGFTIFYGSGGRLVGALTHRFDADYESSAGRIVAGEAF